jgi:hypothetical protein
MLVDLFKPLTSAELTVPAAVETELSRAGLFGSTEQNLS